MLTDREIWNALRAKGLKPCPSKGGKKKRMPSKLKERKAGDVRRECFERDESKCRLRISKDCWVFASWYSGHMHHVKHRSLGGKNELENVVWACPPCHMAHHVPEKVVKSKWSSQEEQ